MAEPATQIDPIFREAEDLRIRLLAVAYRLFRDKGCQGVDTVLAGTSTTARDIVGDTFVRLLVSGKWHPGSGGPDIFPYAKVILDHLFVDLLRRSEHRTAADVDLEEVERFRKSTERDSPFRAIASKETYEWIMRQLGPDKMARAFVEAVQNGATTRAEIAEDLGVTSQEVSNIQRRLQYKLHNMEKLMWEFKDLL